MNSHHPDTPPPVPGRTALVRPRYDGTDHEFQEPLGAEAICGYLIEHGVEARVFDRRLGASLSDIEKFGPDWVGFSLMTAEDAPDALRLRQMLSRPGRRFFAGGLFVTSCMERAKALFPSDTVLIPGEGEGPVWELVTFGRVRGGPRPGPNEWAFASRENLSEYLARGGVINIRTARGCRGGCAFCTTPRLCAPKGFEARDVSLVAQEMAALIRAGYPPVFNFTDDMFGDHGRVEALEEALSLHGVRAAFSLEMRAAEVSLTPPDLWKKLHAGGLCRVFTGMESLEADTLKAWHKPVDVGRLARALNDMRDAGIACEVGYILWHDGQDASGALREAEGLHALGLLTPKSALSRLVLFPGSLLHEKQNARGVELCGLKGEAARMHAVWEDVLSPLLAPWTAAACACPKTACEAFLSGEREPLSALEGCLERLKEMTWQAVRNGRPPEEKDREEVCRELHSLHIACE
ncbi:MAG: radical SAM protein [Clostridia bacterium]|nr:radical SAM protein [Clostridia bacterium]